MAQQGILAVFVLLLLPPGLPGLQEHSCSVHGDPQVTDLLMRMLQSFNPADSPNASILLALRLASDHNLSIEHAMVQRLKEEAVQRVQNNLDFTSGTVALYVMALQASCENPRVVSAFNSTTDLVQLLEDKYEQELNNIKVQGHPLTNYFQIGLDIMALCLQSVNVDLDDVLQVICPQHHPGSGKAHSVDTDSVLALGLICVAGKMDSPQEDRPGSVLSVVRCLVERILGGKQVDGIIGNIYSTGLAMQALFAAQAYYPSLKWNCSQTLFSVKVAISKGEFNNPMAASQLTPSMEGRTYLDARGLNCTADPDNLPIPAPPTPTVPSPVNIGVSYRVVDSVYHSFDNSITVSVSEGSNYLNVMEAAQSLNPLQFNFTTQSSSWGPYLVSINGLAANNAAKTFWQLQNGSTPLAQGIGDYKPSAGELLVSNFTTY